MSKRMTVVQADLLREAVHRAHKEVQNANASMDWNKAGTWDQSDWGSAEVKLLGGWDAQHVEGWLVNPLPALVCGTTGCLAGHICAAAGAHLIIPEAEYQDAKECRDRTVSIEKVLTPDNRIVDIDDYASESLGDWYQTRYTRDGDDLFSGSNTMTEVIQIADSILLANGHEPTGLAE